MSDQEHKCPRRAENYRADEMFPFNDKWDGREHHRACSYCGSMHPDDFMKAMEDGVEVVPTDKNYKAYVDLPHPDPEGLRIYGSSNFDTSGRGDVQYKDATPEQKKLIEDYFTGSEKNYGRPDYKLWYSFGKNGAKVHAKFYFMHLSDEQKVRFIELYNNKTMKIGMPGHFYNPPFFMTFEKPKEA